MRTGIALAAALLVAGMFAAEGRAAPVQVDISGNAYDPSPLTVAVGTTVRWTNSDFVQHTVTSTTGAFGSGYLNNGQSFEHTFGAAGTYNYYCIVHGIGMSGTVHVVDPTPVADADAVPVDALVGETVTFDGSGSSSPLPNVDIVSWEWDFDDTETGSGESTTHSFDAVGGYDVVLTVTDEDARTDTDTVHIEVADPLPPDSDPGGPYTFCLGRDAAVPLNGSGSADPDGTILSWEWDFTPPLNFTPPDLTGEHAEASSFSSAAPGTYDVALRVTDNDGISDTDFATVTVFSLAGCPKPPLALEAGPHVSVPATSPSGASVSFPPPTVTNAVEGTAVACTPTAGSFFPVGTTAVNCTATEPGGNAVSDSLNVTVTPAVVPAALPQITISNAKVKEGNRGTKAMTFLVKLSAPSSQPVTVQFKTQKGTAKPRSDFVGRSGVLTFAPGQTQLKLVVKVKGDLRKEKLEKFKVLLANAVGATILDGEGVGTIRDND
jgi:plastocyanin